MRSGPQLARGCVVARAINLDDLMLDVPEIDGDIKSLQVEMGAIFNVSELYQHQQAATCAPTRFRALVRDTLGCRSYVGNPAAPVPCKAATSL